MLSSQQGHELIKHIERTGARLVLVGDKAQLPSVNAGRLFGLTQEYGIETTIMDEIVRQKNEVLKEAVWQQQGER
ncbi:conjugative transfer protein TraI [Legionella busanensis]|uniref:Conjugative transfer protein TraI n=1 Tax=Legionella busanensis TaxID=190655 RepID=A0A378JMQ1_9GAMM|nr:conjugative transfer protein TraI [Legionella busanensis]